MHLGRLRARRLRERVILLLLPMLALRVLVPDGFMPRFGTDNELSMQMCHGDARSAAAMRRLQDRPAAPLSSDHGKSRHDAPCTFAASAAAAPPVVPQALPVAAPPPNAAPVPAHSIPVPRALHRTQSARAPPALA